MSTYLLLAVPEIRVPVPELQVPQFCHEHANYAACTLDVHEWIGKVCHLVHIVPEVPTFVTNREVRSENPIIIDVLVVFYCFYKFLSTLGKGRYFGYLAGLEAK